MSEIMIPPHSKDAETAVLGALFIDPKNAIEKCRTIGLTADAFYDTRNQTLFDAIIDMEADNIDSIIITQILIDRKLLEKVGGYDHLTEIQNNGFNAGYVESYSKVIMEKHRARLAIQICDETIKEIHNGENPDIANVKHVQEMEAIAPQESETMDIVVDSAMQEIEDIVSGKIVFLPFPWRNFHMRTFGIPVGAITPMLGRDKTGKSRLGMALAAHWIISGIPTLVFAFEDGKRRYLHSLAATVGGYDGFGIRRNPSPQYMDKCRNTMNSLKKRPVYVVDGGMSAEGIVATIGAYKRKHGIQAVIIDGFKDIMESKGENRTSAENHIFETVKKGAQRYDVGVLQIEHPHDVEDGKWLSRRNIRGSKQRSHSARMFLVYQDSGFPESIRSEYNIGDGKGFVALDCQACSYGERSMVILRPELERGRFLEITPNEQTYREE
jgi:replicative DNA helicase